MARVLGTPGAVRTIYLRGTLRAARATADDTTIFMVGGPTSVAYTISRWEASLP
jgi:hypothetical protein